MKPGDRDTEVTVAKLAEWLSTDSRRVSRQSAHRKMMAVAKIRPDIIHRRGRLLWAFASELQAFIPEMRDTPLHRTVRSLTKRVEELERRVDAFVRGGPSARQQPQAGKR